MISVIAPSRSRPEKAYYTWQSWFGNKFYEEIDWILSLDEDDKSPYNSWFDTTPIRIIRNKNRSAVDAINNAAKLAKFDIMIVVSDDTDCGYMYWDRKIELEVDGKSDYLLKTKDGIQDYIVTMTVMDRTYYERDGYIYHPDFFHQFADTYLTCKADILGRLIKSDLKFPHMHYSHLHEFPDELNKRNDASWKEGQNTFVRLMKQFTPEERARIKDKSMQGFMKHVGL